ncbi:MAG: hypothetical protein JW882_03480 [Deltaproteobacteria bacterium]|nr:hypothetical protein [Deltaproteobacteria bacterium]
MLSAKICMNRYHGRLSHGSTRLLILTPLILLLCLFFNPNLVLGDDEIDPVVKFEDGLFICRAEDITLKKILDDLLDECQVEIRGLEGRENEPVSFNFRGSIEQER